MNILAIVQARMGSTRLPNKVMALVNNKPMIQILLDRLSNSKLISKIIVATSVDKKNDTLHEFLNSSGYDCFRGSENNVLERFYLAAKQFDVDVVIRITGDCPLVDAELVDACITRYIESSVDYVSNISPPTYPDGLDIEVFSFQALERAFLFAKLDFDKEHVTPFIRNSDQFSKKNIFNNQDLSSCRWTVDEKEDLAVIRNVFDYFYPNVYFGWQEVYQLQSEQPELFQMNLQLNRNEGDKLGKGQKLYKRAKKIIPGGTMLLSKRPEMFLPDFWPSYFSKASGCNVWDLDGNKFIDMSIMGIGTNTLGYGHPEVDDAVMQNIKNGNMSTLNCPEEVYLAEKLLEINPWADMVRFARSGGEINSIAIRIARAATGKDKIAICGYHGWHDWYLSTNLKEGDGLDGHLLPGLEPLGVPKGLTGTTLPFNYNKIEELEYLVNKHPGQIAAIKMEVSRNTGPQDNFLAKVRKIASDNNIVLIFDECTSGFRETFGGLYKKFDVEPDLAIFAKTMGNGYAISACVGRDEIMSAAEKTFISSTFWTERVGPTAALKTLEVMEREKSWEYITNIGTYVSNKWQLLADKYELSISRWGLPALCGFTFLTDNSLEYKTFITQEMLKKGYLASNSFYASMAHNKEIVDIYFEELDPIF